MRRLAAHFGTGASSAFGAGPRSARSPGQIVKERCYLVDNVSYSRLSDLKRVVNHKARGGLGGPGNDSCEARPCVAPKRRVRDNYAFSTKT
jgi:hypothetical protein